MKVSKLLLSIILLMVSFIICEDRRTVFANNIKSYTKSKSKPNGIENVVKNFETELSVLFYTLTIKELNEVKVKFDLSDSLTQQIKIAPYARSSGAIKVSDNILSNYYTYEETIGSAIKEDDGKITFALIRTKSKATINYKYQTSTTRECHRSWLFFKKCHDVEFKVKLPLTEAEKILITEGVKYSVGKPILEGVEILKRNDYELYMTDKGSIFSPDHKSVAHITYFGNIAIGPVSELNAILPIVDNYTKEYAYPIKDNVYGEDLILNNGSFHKFDFLMSYGISKFPREYVNYMKEKSLNGPFILEVKKNGNVILYEKKTNKIIWETKTSNQGVGPYNFHLTNDKKLILEDSNGKILYEYKYYSDVPTIFYGCYKETGGHVYNGHILYPAYQSSGLNKFMSNINHSQTEEVQYPIGPSQLHIKTDNDNKYTITYGGRIKDSKEWFTFDNKGNNNNNLYPTQTKIDMFKAFFSNNNDYDICYTVRSSSHGWTNFGCNGEEVGINSNDNSYIYNLIIYIKEKRESTPTISKVKIWS